MKCLPRGVPFFLIYTFFRYLPSFRTGVRFPSPPPNKTDHLDTRSFGMVGLYIYNFSDL